MRLLRKVTKKEWKEIGEKYKDGGVYNYRGKRTLFYNGEKLYDGRNRRYLIYDWEERLSWEVIIVLPGVQIIPEDTFFECCNVKVVIMSDTVTRIERDVFQCCSGIMFVRLSKSLEYIGDYAFYDCTSLTSIFIPTSCREISDEAFKSCIRLIVLSVPRHTQLGIDIIENTAQIRASPFNILNYDDDIINEWIKTINDGPDFNLHRECASMSPSSERIDNIIKAQGLKALNRKNSIGITALEYLSENPYTDLEINQQAIARKYILEMMGEVV